MSGLIHHLFHPTRCYALCSLARSGAHLLSGGLRATRLAGKPEQYFHDQLAPQYAARYGLDAERDFTGYVRGIIAASATPNAVFAFRIESWELERFVARLRKSGEFGSADARELDLLRFAFPRLRCVHLTRQNKVRQAISKARAMQTNLWVIDPEKDLTGEATFDPALIDQCLLSASRAEALWSEFFQRNEIEPLSVTYEDLCADYAATVGRVLNFLRIRPPRGFSLGAPTTVRQADATTEEWVARYTALQDRQS